MEKFSIEWLMCAEAAAAAAAAVIYYYYIKLFACTP